jgi:hypothetical protein
MGGLLKGGLVRPVEIRFAISCSPKVQENDPFFCSLETIVGGSRNTANLRDEQMRFSFLSARLSGVDMTVGPKDKVRLTYP